jgi:hypothetical protein
MSDQDSLVFSSNGIVVRVELMAEGAPLQFVIKAK